MTERESLFASLREKLDALESEITKLADEGHLDWETKQLPDDVRSKLLSMGGSMTDYVFWVRKRPQPDDLGAQMYWAEEMEAGTGAWGVDARQALEHYLSDDILDRRRYTDHRGLDLDYPE